MSCLYSKIKEDEQDYRNICKLLNEEIKDNFYEHFYKLKNDKRIVWKDYRYQLKESK